MLHLPTPRLSGRLRVALAAALLTVAAGCTTTEPERRAAQVTPATPVVPTVSTPEWAFDRPELSVLRASEHKVFAHYFCTFPISIDNKDPASDYYQNGFLSRNGERNKHVSYGGYLRQRPLPRPPREGADWKRQDLRHEIELASRAGYDGFTFDLLGVDGKFWELFKTMLDLAQEVDPSFRIVLMPDMMAQLRGSPDKLVPAIQEVANHPSLYRLDDGRLVVSPFNAQMQTPEWWAEQFKVLSDSGIEVAFVPTFQAWWKYADDYGPISYGFTDWGAGNVDELANPPRSVSPQRAHERGKIWMAPVRPQDFRPKNAHAHESHNSGIFQRMWQIAIEGDADWVQLITWNDYSEASEIAPSTGTQYAFYDLSAYYTTWFKLGHPPEIVRDALYYTYRIQRSDAKPDPALDVKTFKVLGKQAYDEIELLALLKAPGTLEIELDGTVVRKQVPAGLQTLSVPLRSGKPVFRLIRDGETAMEVPGTWTIDASLTVGIPNLLYHAGGGTAARIESTR